MATITSIINDNSPTETIALAKSIVKGIKDFENQNKTGVEEKTSSKTQIRKLFSTLRQIQMMWQQNEDNAYKELVMFGPRVLYQTSKTKSLTSLAPVVQDGIEAVGRDPEKLQRFVDFFEAVVAYYIAN